MASNNPIQIEGVRFDLGKKSGALVIYCPKLYRGVSICLQYADFWSDTHQVWAHVVEKTINETQMFIAVFPKLEERQYQVFSSGLKAPRTITIFANNIAEIDWR